MRFTTHLFDTWREFARRRREIRDYRRTVNAISELPRHILKDIGWPSAYDRGGR